MLSLLNRHIGKGRASFRTLGNIRRQNSPGIQRLRREHPPSTKRKKQKQEGTESWRKKESNDQTPHNARKSSPRLDALLIDGRLLWRVEGNGVSSWEPSERRSQPAIQKASKQACQNRPAVDGLGDVLAMMGWEFADMGEVRSGQ